MNNLLQKLLLGGSTVALISGVSVAAMAQAAAGGADSIETVTVTGTSIRGTAPVGQNLITVSPADIKAVGATDAQTILASVPALMGFGADSRGQSNTGASQPSIHSLGSSGTNSTMVLFDGHRLVTSGDRHSEPDPGFIPVNMIERVEVLADGASATYGSDAVAGVVNFITRKRFDGVQLDASGSFIDGKTDNSFGILMGKEWADGSVIMAFDSEHQGQLKNTARPWTYPNHRYNDGVVQGERIETVNGNAPLYQQNTLAKNSLNYNCSPASLQPKGYSNIFTSPTSGMNVANNATTGFCTNWAYGSATPETDRQNGMIKVEEDFGQNWTFTGDLIWSYRHAISQVAAGTLTATAFNTGPQANPFYVSPVGYSGTATSETVRWDSTDLIGTGSSTDTDETQHADFNAEYRLGNDDGTPFGDIVFDFLAVYGHDNSQTWQNGVLNASVATLALNGTNNASGNTTTCAPNTALVGQFQPCVGPLNLPLTTANALDVWNPAATNQTSPEVLSALDDQDRPIPLGQGAYGRALSAVRQFRLSATGTIFTLPAGPVKAALGVENVRYDLWENSMAPAGVGSAILFDNNQSWKFPRHTYSGYAEAIVPLVSPEMNVPFVQKLNLDLEGRYDQYSDVGTTTNPKIGFDWQVNDDLKVRADWSTSFVAPGVDILGDQYGASEIAKVANTSSNVNVPTATFPLVTEFGIPGCTTAVQSCNISSLQGIEPESGNHNGFPAKGRGWTVGFDYTPSFLPGLSTSFTYWHVQVLGASQSPGITYSLNTAGEAHLLTFYPAPGGATPAQIAQFTTGILANAVLPQTVNFIFYSPDSPFISFKEEGVDYSVNYRYDTDDYGSFKIGSDGSIMTKGYEAVAGSPWFHVINTTGLNNNNTSLGLQVRSHIGWDWDAWSATLYWNYTGAYKNLSGSAANPTTNCGLTGLYVCDADALGNTISGGDHVSPNSTFDVHLGYDFNAGLLGDDTIHLSVQNIFDTKPPFVASSSNGIGVGSVLGRIITLSATAKL